MFDFKTPFDGMHLQWFADGGGQGVIPEEPSGQGDEPPEEYFYEFETPDGEEVHKFSSPDDVGNFMREHFLRHSDYTRKTQEVAEQRRQQELLREQFENDRKQFHSQRDEWNSRSEQLKKYDDFLKKNPHVEQKLKEQLGELTDDDLERKMETLFQQKYGKELEAMKARERQEQLRQQREAAEKNLAGKYKDFNVDVVNKAYEALQQGDLTTLMEVLYFSEIGRKSIPELEQKILEDQAKKKQAGLITSSGAKGTPSSQNASTLEEAKLNAYKEFGLT